MKTIMPFTVSVLVVGLLLSSASFAGYPDNMDIARECDRAANQLSHLADTKSDNPCSGDLRIAAAYIESAGLKLRYKKFEQALTSMKYGELELKEISTGRAYCSYFSQAVKPIIASAIKISSEIEVLERLKKLSHKSP